MRIPLLISISSLFLMFIVKCSQKEVNPNDSEALFKDAEESFEDGRYTVAIEKYRDIKNRFPYSSRAVDAEIRIADAYFDQESFIESASSYEIFQELHPSHPKSDYVLFRIGLSYYNQVPSDSARDLSAAHKALEIFAQFRQRYPSSKYGDEAKVCMGEIRKKMADYENNIADFYFRKNHYLSASIRYAALLKDFPDSDFAERALFRLAKSYHSIREYGKAADALRHYLNKYSTGSYLLEAKSLLDELNAKN